MAYVCKDPSKANSRHRKYRTPEMRKALLEQYLRLPFNDRLAWRQHHGITYQAILWWARAYHGKTINELRALVK